MAEEGGQLYKQMSAKLSNGSTALEAIKLNQTIHFIIIRARLKKYAFVFQKTAK